ncbi:MAG: hypothetical protein E6Q97_31035 [Desulfurellales bacterium]|jgi:hypothetical protein|nr:MAG: hypothetical protein E6Q97_31035 [Desulfurellales bacterium]
MTWANFQRIDEPHIHVVPLDDLRGHVPSFGCWCNPSNDEETPNVVVHHAMDGREAFESGERLPS